MVRVEWTRPALTDLRDVHEYIARTSPRYAEVTVRKIKAAADRLSDGPFIGHELPDLPDSPYRQILVGNTASSTELTKCRIGCSSSA